GSVGKICIREMLKRPEFRLVGVLAYSESKAGKDAGELVGLGPIGIKVTTDQEAIYAMDADVVIWAGLPVADPEALDEIVLRLLESGKSVVTASRYHYPARHGKA